MQYRRRHKDFYTKQWSKTYDCYLSYVYKEEVSPANSGVLAICRFSVYASLQDWWNDREISLSQLNKVDESLLELATRADSISICERLLQLGIETSSSILKARALAIAARAGSIDLVKFFIQQGAKSQSDQENGSHGTALIAAASRSRNFDTVKLLLGEGADINPLSKTGKYSIGLAATGIADFDALN